MYDDAFESPKTVLRIEFFGLPMFLHCIGKDQTCCLHGHLLTPQGALFPYLTLRSHCKKRLQSSSALQLGYAETPQAEAFGSHTARFGVEKGRCQGSRLHAKTG